MTVVRVSKPCDNLACSTWERRQRCRLFFVDPIDTFVIHWRLLRQPFGRDERNRAGMLRKALTGNNDTPKAARMADDNIITWNVTNWITVVLMAAVFFFALGAVQKYLANRKAA